MPSGHLLPTKSRKSCVRGLPRSLAVMEVIYGHTLVPHWLRFAWEDVDVQQGCKQGALERPSLRNILLDEVMAPVRQKWRRQGRRFDLPVLQLRMEDADVGRLGTQV